MTHKFNAGDTLGTDFMIALGYGQSGNGVWTNCATSATFCAGIEEESINDLSDYSASGPINAILSVTFNSGTNTVTAILNGHSLFSRNPPAHSLNPGTYVHLGGGGDLSQPAPTLMREALIFNAALSSGQQSAVLSNMTAFYSGVSFS
jgi:hypothetical protein